MAETISSLVGGVVQAMSTRNDNKIEAAKEAVVNVVKETVVKEVIHDTLNVDLSGLATKADVSASIYDDTEIRALINAKADANDVFTKNETLSKENIENALSEKANISDIPDVSNFATKDELYNDTEIKASLIEKADANNVYTKTEVISLLEAKANLEDVYKKVDTYSAERIQELLDLEANKDSVYTIAQIDNLLSEKANSNDIPDVSNFATKDELYDDTEIKSMLANKANSDDIPDVSNFIEKDSLTNISSINGNIKDYIGVSENESADIELSAADKTSGKGTRLQISKVDGIYYTKNSASSSSLSSDREIAVKGDIPDISALISRIEELETKVAALEAKE